MRWSSKVRKEVSNIALSEVTNNLRRTRSRRVTYESNFSRELWALTAEQSEGWREETVNVPHSRVRKESLHIPPSEGSSTRPKRVSYESNLSRDLWALAAGTHVV